MEGVSFDVQAYTKQGLGRPNNQDCIGYGSWISEQNEACGSKSKFEFDDFPQLFLVADGMGGHDDGATASKLVISILKNHFKHQKEFSIKEAISDTHSQLTIRGQHSTRPMGSTIVGCIINLEEITYFNVGDSAAFEIDQTSILQITRDDHRDAGRQNILSQCLGGGIRLPKPNVFRSPLISQKTILLVSDGVSKVLDPPKIYEIAMKSNVDMAQRLCDEAQFNGSRDDVSALVIRPQRNS